MAKSYRTYKKERYIFFWLTIITYFVPVIAVTAALLPFVTVSNGAKLGIGCVVVLLHLIVFLCGFLLKFFAHFPFFNGYAVVITALSYFFTLEVFADYVYTFRWIGLAMTLSSIAACVLWVFHNQYKRKSQTVNDVIKSGVLGGKR